MWLNRLGLYHGWAVLTFGHFLYLDNPILTFASACGGCCCSLLFWGIKAIHAHIFIIINSQLKLLLKKSDKIAYNTCDGLLLILRNGNMSEKYPSFRHWKPLSYVWKILYLCTRQWSYLFICSNQWLQTISPIPKFEWREAKHSTSGASPVTNYLSLLSKLLEICF